MTNGLFATESNKILSYDCSDLYIHTNLYIYIYIFYNTYYIYIYKYMPHNDIFIAHNVP